MSFLNNFSQCKRYFILLLVYFIFQSGWVVNASSLTKDEFNAQLQHLGINVTQLEKKEKLSRYELTRLLNAVECHDCVLPSQSMRQDYNLSFWNQFLQLP